MINMIKNKLVGAVCVLGAVSMLAVAGVASAQTVSLTPSVTNVAVGDIFTLTVQGTEWTTDVSSGSITVGWDVTQLQLAPGTDLVSISASAAANGFPIDFFSTLVPGQLNATYATFGTVPGPTFDFFSLDFEAIPPPSASGVSLAMGVGGDWQDGAGQAVLGVIYNGATVNVSAVPVPAAVWLFGSGLLGLVGVARPRRLAA